jgi:hypothetical protein
MPLLPVRERLIAGLFSFALAASAGSLFAQQQAEIFVPAAKRAPAVVPAEAPNVTAMRALRSKTAFHVQSLPLADFVKFLSKKYRLHFKLDPDGLKRARVDSGTPISADIDGMPLSAALREILGPLELTHRVVNGEISITARAAEPPVVLIEAPPMPPQVPRGRILVFPPQQEGGLQLLSQLPVELRFVKRVASPTKEQLRAIKTDLEQCLRDAGSGAVPVSCELLPDKIADCVVRHLSKADASHYLDEVHKRRAREREACVYMFVTMLDQRTGLSDEQRKSLVVVLRTHWKACWSQAIEMAVRNGDNEILGIPDMVILPLLEREQADVWKHLPKLPEADAPFDPERMGSVGTPIDDPEFEF